ncbi:MAG: methyltransferase [Mycobacterium sp.]
MADMTEKTRDRRLWWRHLISFLVAPVTMTLVIPGLIVIAAGVRAPEMSSPATIGLVIAGGVLIAVGVALLIWTVALFDRVGKGTLGVGRVLGEPVHLVVRGPYRHVRNPMITGVVCILLGRRPSPRPVGCCCGSRSFPPSRRSSSGSGKNPIW